MPLNPNLTHATPTSLRAKPPVSRDTAMISPKRGPRAPLLAVPLLALATLAGTLALPDAARAAPPAPAAPPPATRPAIRENRPITLDVDKAELIRLADPARTVFVANPEVADVQIASPTSVIVYARRIGTTSVFAISETGQTASYAVRVLRPAGEIAAALQREVPNAQVSVTAAGEGITISGHVASPRDADKLRAAARTVIGEKQPINFAVTIDASVQVTLRVRVAEVSRNIDRRFGVNWSSLFNNNSIAVGLLTGRTAMAGFGNFIAADATAAYGSAGLAYRSGNGQVNVSALIDALDHEGLATVLAEPNLTATSGETANFLAGGEFPIPVPQGNQSVTVEYKRFGVSVEFTPVVLDAGRISVKVRPEVSQLTTVGDLRMNGVEIPALTVRRAETTVEMGSGESFAIAGLFQNTATNALQALPGLGEVPILGPLFRSTSFQRNESELVIIVTPILVRPVARAADLRVPTDGLRFPSDLERILAGKVIANPTDAPRPRLRGTAGLMLE